MANESPYNNFYLKHSLILGFFLCICTKNYCEAFVVGKKTFVDRGSSSWLLVSLLPNNNMFPFQRTSTNPRRMAESDNDEKRIRNNGSTKEKKKEEKNLLTYEELSRDPDLLRQVERESDGVFNNLALTNKIGDAVTATGWLFVIVGVLLEMNGYGYVVKDGRVTIDTLENRAFQIEINNQNRRARMGTTTTSYTNSRVPSLSASLQHYMKAISENEGNA